MKRIIIIALCLCLFLCGCTPKFSAAGGSVLDREFIETFPFHSKALGTAVDWFNEHDAYKIESTNEDFNVINVIYSGNINWQLSAFCYPEDPSDLCSISGYSITFYSDDAYSEEDWITIYNCAVAELTDLCGDPIRTTYDGNGLYFHYGKLQIMIESGRTVYLEMSYRP